ncbi:MULTISPECIES: hypothetical protein [unclassified Streptomyces]|uniref:hypothetical protein n=1 Tax=unclassified Streptomyces TaxID=2593676 RepID=UPI002E0EC6F2|nr:hypothetical protein OG452_24635 [Streptomyces sp. NBC_01197]WSS49058.1 hypothetical protein OG708_10595 [Streptomyces sp. NBC_01180]
MISIAAGGVAAMARKDSKRSADAAEAALALQQEEAEERREAARPRPRLELRNPRGHLWQLRNVGDGDAKGVTILADGLPAFIELPDMPVDLVPGAACEFTMSGAMGSPIPPQVKVQIEGEDPVALST